MARLLHVLESPLPSGAATQAKLLAGAECEHEVTVVCLRPLGPWRRWWRGAGASVRSLGMRWPADPFAAVAWRRLLQELKPDAVQTNDAASAKLIRWAGRGGVRWGHVYRTPADGRPADETSAATHADSVASSVASAVAGDEAVAVLPNAAAAESLSDDQRRACRRRLGVADGAPLIAAGMAIHDATPAKEIAWAADLVRLLRPGVRLVVYGEGPARLAAERFAAAATEPGTVRFAGVPGDRRPDNWREAVATADVVWAPQATHLGATPVLEAMASGTPVVTTGVGESTPAVRRVRLHDRAGWARETIDLLERETRGESPLSQEHSPKVIAARRAEWLLA